MACDRCGNKERETVRYLFGLVEPGRPDERLCVECLPAPLAWPVCVEPSEATLAARRRAAERTWG